ncbi:unnamed protein product [marine sediment metagenome]|uniref:Uncharacterized protein n=1 Tax=marine sediment metagenome TaxID=412755 RepID=X0XSG8_9ZZZZ
MASARAIMLDLVRVITMSRGDCSASTTKTAPDRLLRQLCISDSETSYEPSLLCEDSSAIDSKSSVYC